MFALSLGIHLAVFLLIARSQLLPEFKPDETPVTYVDMVTLPVASPQSGTPAPAGPAAPHPAAAAPTPVAPPAAMALPAAKPKAKVAAPATPKTKAEKPAPVDEAKAFNERMAKIERQAEEKRQADVMERLRNKGKGGRTGMPGAKGTEAGSDYRSYLTSRLKDALKETMAYQSKSPVVIATLTIGSDGQIAYHVEKNAGDPVFDDAVARAVTIAGRSLKPPPGGGQFKGLFRFRPEGVNVR
jgi:colicin import membrane protein